jgi:hypothetical protein
LKLKCDEPLSNFDFKFKLRRYSKVVVVDNDTIMAHYLVGKLTSMQYEAGAYTRSPFRST